MLDNNPKTEYNDNINKKEVYFMTGKEVKKMITDSGLKCWQVAEAFHF